MKLQTKPRLGVLALMLEGYEPLFPGITARQHAYVEEVIASLDGVADFVFPRVALNQADIESLVVQYNAQDLDGILILLLSYSQGQYLVRAVQRNALPLALALVQPDETVGDDFEELELTVNQGIHGSQDNANCLMRAGVPCAYFAGSRKNGELAAFVGDFATVAHTLRAMRRMRIGVIGRLAGMGDVVTDDMAVYRKLGPEFRYDSIARCAACARRYRTRTSRSASNTSAPSLTSTPACRRNGTPSPCACTWASRRTWSRAAMPDTRCTLKNSARTGASSICPFLAASNLMAEGYGYAAEGDATCAMLMAVMIRLCGRATSAKCT